MAQLGTWFDDYNEAYPHSGLKMQSPLEFLRGNLVIGIEGAAACQS